MNLINLSVIFSLGFFSIVSQAVVFREYMSATESNDLTVGIFFFSWLIWLALTAFVNTKTDSLIKGIRRLIPSVFLLYPFAFAFQFWMILNLRNFAGVESYTQFNPFTLFLWSILVNSPVSILTSCFFSASSIWLEKDYSLPVSKVYRFEVFGSFAGGCAATILFYFGLNQIFVALIATLVLTVSVALANFAKKRSVSFLVAPLIVLILILTGTGNKFSNEIALREWGRFFPKDSYLLSFTTGQSEYLAGKYYDQLNIVRDEMVYDSFPDTESSAFDLTPVLASKPFIKNALVIGQGLNLCVGLGKLASVREIIWCSGDPEYSKKLLELATVKPESNLLSKSKGGLQAVPPIVRLTTCYLTWQEHQPTLSQATSYHKIVIADKDIRTYLEQQGRKFDLAYIGFSSFNSLHSNRYCTIEFLGLLKKHITPGGIVVLSFPSGENFMSPESAYLGATIRKTIRELFGNVLLIPGEKSCFIASSPYTKLPLDVDTMLANLRIAQKTGSEIPPEIIYSIYFPDRAGFAETAFKHAEEKYSVPPNTDSDPQLFLPSFVSMWRKLGTGNPSIILDLVPYKKILLLSPAIFFFLSLAILMIIKGKSPANPKKNTHKILVLSSGFTGIGICLTLIFLFQTILGAIHLYFGLVSSLFMLGLFVGGTSYERISERLTGIKPENILVIILSVNIVFLALISAFSGFFNNLISFSALFATAGFINGLYFVFVAKELKKNGEANVFSAGTLVNADNFGAAIGSFFCGILFLPIGGVKLTIFFLTLILAANMIVNCAHKYSSKGGIR